MFLKRIGAFIAAVPLVGVGFLAVTAGSASATTGPAVSTLSQAGVQASGRNFRYISATLTVPDDSLVPYDGILYPQEYIQLSNGPQLSTVPIAGTGDEYARAGVESCQVAAQAPSGSYACPSGDNWTAFVDFYNGSLNGGFLEHYWPLPVAVNSGDGVNFSIYYNQAGNEMQFVITPPDANGQTGTFTWKTQAYGPTFDHAAAIDDFTNGLGTPIALPPFIHAFRINQFLQGALTTYSGAHGSFTGPWTSSLVLASSNGLLPPSGTARVSTNALWSDGLAGNGTVRPDDAVGIWAR
jgi:hypothetical protein